MDEVNQQVLISAIIPTFRREQLLAEAVRSVLAQELEGAEIEVIVVNDAGEPLSRAEWQEDPRVMVLHTYRTERCVARNTGAALSRGDYLHFLDDDDVALQGAYRALLQAARAAETVCSYGAYEAVGETGEVVATVLPTVSGRVYAWLIAGMGIPLGAALIRREAFFASGGFDPSYLINEDMELLQRIAKLGQFRSTDAVTARFRMGAHSLSTSDWARSAETCRLQREKAFADPDTLPQLKASLREQKDPELVGRLTRYYLGSAARHFSRGRVLTAVSRAVTGFSLSPGSLVCRSFYRGLRVVDPTRLFWNNQQ